MDGFSIQTLWMDFHRGPNCLDKLEYVYIIDRQGKRKWRSDCPWGFGPASGGVKCNQLTKLNRMILRPDAMANA